MLRFGGNVAACNVLNYFYFSRNLDNSPMAGIWAAESLAFYGRAS
jgi:hypothetical protein